MKVYAISDIHGCAAALEEALALFADQLDSPDTKLIFLGDYIHGGESGRAVLDRIMGLQYKYGSERVIALAGNHDLWVVDGTATIDYMRREDDENLLTDDGDDDKYINWISSLPLYHVEGNTLFVHAGIDEEAGDWWEWGTSDDIFTGKFPAETGPIPDFDLKIVAGHIGTYEIAGNRAFHDIFYDGYSHYYIDGSVLDTGRLNVIMVDTDTDEYYRVTEAGSWPVLPYDEEF